MSTKKTDLHIEIILKVMYKKNKRDKKFWINEWFNWKKIVWPSKC